MPHNLTRTHVVLFIATFISTTLAGAYLTDNVIPWEAPGRIYLGLPFSLTLMLILLSHELSHYFMSRRHNVSATLPYFIPAPTIVGTFGAIIKMKPPIYDRKSLIDIGASGPIGGFIISVAAVIAGLSYSKVLPLDSIHNQADSFAFGPSIIFYVLVKLILNIEGSAYFVSLHPIAAAGWVGLLVTSLNLLPIGQLDGGHITYALFGEMHSLIAKITIPVLIVLGILYWPGWIIWAVLMIIIGFRHPPVVYPSIQLDGRRKLVGWISLVIFILTFTPAPVQGL